MAEAAFYIKAFVALFLLVNPLEGIPIFLGATQTAGVAVRATVAKRASVAVCIILLVSALFGDGLLRLFEITIGAFQIGGGAILFMIATRMVFHSARPAAAKAPAGEFGPGFAIVPLAIPLMAGPGAIAGAILYGTRMRSLLELAILAGVIVLVSIAAYLSLRGAESLSKYLGDTGISVATSVMGLIIAAIAVEMIGRGVATMFGLRVFGGQ